jgi:transcriptional regulator of acetoin/glycerol metabolism
VKDLPDHVVHAAPLQTAPPSEVSAAVGAVPSSGGDQTLKDAKERWLQVLEVAYLRDLLARHDGNVSSAAKTAGIDRKTFHRLINKYGLRA